MRKTLLITALASCFYVGAGCADEITEQIQSGAQAYQQQDFQLAIEELNYAVAQIQEKLNAENATLLPEPLAGWTADSVENTSGAMAMMGGGANMARDYRRGNETVNLNIIANSPMLSGMMAMFSNPMLLGSNPDMKPYRYKRIKGLKETSGNTVTLTLMMMGQVMIKAEGQNLKDEKVLEAYLDKMDFERIQRAFVQ